jgi:DNA polymerase delta subunit 1
MRAAAASIRGGRVLFENALMGKKFPGAYVMEPKRGFYLCPILTTDFASLYPNIMRTHNVCLSTQVPDIDAWRVCDGPHTCDESCVIELDPVGDEEARTERICQGPHICNETCTPDLHVSPVGFGYVKDHVRRGVIPRMLTRLLEARAAVRKAMKTEPDASKKAMMNAEQNELKVAANSTYGLFGDINSDLCSIPGGYSVTAWGKHYIQMVKAALDEDPKFEKKYGFKIKFPGFKEKYGLQVIYSDTDSLFCALMKMMDDADIGPISLEIQQWINKTSGLLRGSLEMAIENVSNPFLMVNKKSYAKVIFDEDKNKQVLKKSGLGNRSLTDYSADLLHRVLEMGMLERRPTAEIEDYIFETVSKLWRGEVTDYSLLMHTTNLSKSLESYKNKTTPHLAAATQLKAVDREVDVGDRIKHYMVNVTTVAKPSKGERTIAAELMTDHTLHIESYVEEIHKTLKKKALFLISGSTPARKSARLKFLVAPCDRASSKLKVAPAIVKSGAIEAFLTRTKRAATTAFVEIPDAEPLKRTKQMRMEAFAAVAELPVWKNKRTPVA